ncbi:MAG: elongation factor P maturation arginine rhamnosyltransferase EarP [Thiobacillaceae bacterium]
MMRRIQTCDLFCTVVDNYGDIGIASRLARQLHEERGLQVRLWVDDLHTFSRLHPDIAQQAESQNWRGVGVRRWAGALGQIVPHDLVIEAFARELPESFLQAMAAQPVKPVWLNLEYLSAEPWVEGCHGLASPHPRLPLVRYFFFPGYTRATGGLLREQGLIEDVESFQLDAKARAAFWQELGLPLPQTGELRVSLFAYENAAIPALLESLAGHARPVSCLVPESKALAPALAYFGQSRAQVGERLERGSLSLHVLPFLAQDKYDRLLWACDLNIVRGEDSFVCAQFAGRPVLWQAYVQQGDVHGKKVRAWLDRYLEGASPQLAAQLQDLFLAWNQGDPLAPDWLETLPGWLAHAHRWKGQLAALPSLSEALVKFATSKL